MKKLIVVLLCSCTPLAIPTNNNQSIDLLSDGVFRSGIKTVQLYPDKNEVANVLLPAVVPKNEQILRVEFDDLTTTYHAFTAKITHCNADWSKSSLANLDFLNDFNSFPITQYAFSSDTHIPYIHYWFQLPPLKLSGNYVLTVYQDDNTPVFSKRFMVYENSVKLGSFADISGANQLGNKQAINLKMNYNPLAVMNPATQFEVSIRQNQRWDNLIQNVPPTFIFEGQKEIDYRIIDEQYMHDGGNEYRFVDLRSILNTGQNIARIDRTLKPFRAFAATDQSRAGGRYSQYLDFNGNFVIQNYDSPLQYSENYLNVNFTLPVKKPVDGKVFISGRFAENAFSTEVELVYDSARKHYSKELLLKQGWYNYQYIVNSSHVEANILEGNHFETENLYEVFVYFKSLQPRADLLVGYIQFTKNAR